MGETRVYELYDKTTGEGLGVCATRYEARKGAADLRCSVRRVWVSKIITNRPERFARCETR